MINTVYGTGAVVVPRCWTSGKVNVLALIGSSKVADHLKKHAPEGRTACAPSSGLDAKNAAIVLPDADLELAVKECLLGALSFNGQRCTALKMLIVHRSIVDAFLAALHRGAGQAQARHAVGDGRQHHAAAGAGKADLHDRGWSTTPRRKGARVVNEGGGERLRHAVLPGRGLPGDAKA